jgi:hypothetical protein
MRTVYPYLMPLTSLLAAACLALVASCAGVDALDCKSNWYAIGQRDGLERVSPQDDLHALSCPGSVDTARYREGWRDGLARRELHP